MTAFTDFETFAGFIALIVLNPFFSFSFFLGSMQPKICTTADSMCLSLLVFTKLFSEVARSQPVKPARKQNSTRNSQSGSFKVIHFGITEKPTTGLQL